MKSQKEPEAIRELHRIREAMLDEEDRLRSKRFRADLDRLAKEFARKHRLERVKAVAIRLRAKSGAARPLSPAVTG